MNKSIEKLNESCSWRDLTEGMQIYSPATSVAFKTGEWTSIKPELEAEKCIHCLMCVPVCPDSCIPVYKGIRGKIDYDHCKGCGICAKVCPTGALTMEGVK